LHQADGAFLHALLPAGWRETMTSGERDARERSMARVIFSPHHGPHAAAG